MKFDTILYNKAGHVATIKLNRPQVLNAMNRQLWLDFQDALRRCARRCRDPGAGNHR